jgi:hypothetical protein
MATDTREVSMGQLAKNEMFTSDLVTLYFFQYQ